MENALSYDELKKRYLTISQSQNDAIITSDESKCITSWSKGAKNIFGYEDEEVIGKTISIIIPQKLHKSHEQGMERMNSGGPPRVIGKTVELEGVRKDGSVFPLELTLGFWSSDNKKYYSAIIRDISKRKENERIINRQNEQIVFEKNRSDNLLKNILPEQIIPQLKKNGSTEPQKFDDVSVLFMDIEKFTEFAERISDQALVKELHVIFSKFDSIVKQTGLEKIKTIGDAYMCAGGLPEENKTHAVDVIITGLQFLNFISERRELFERESKKYWRIRIGIHSGSVLAGVVGEWKFTYDIWGDTVIIASRMEQSGQPGKINISQSTYEKVKDFFVCDYRGKVSAKNKGEMDMYIIDQIQPHLSVDGKGLVCNEKFFDLYKQLEV